MSKIANEELYHLYDIFLSTLSNRNRIKIINLLRKRRKNVSQISRELGMNQTTVSHNLSRLLKCGFVVSKPNGKERYYSLNKETIVPLIGLVNKHVKNYCKKRCCNE